MTVKAYNPLDFVPDHCALFRDDLAYSRRRWRWRIWLAEDLDYKRLHNKQRYSHSRIVLCYSVLCCNRPD